VPDELEQLRVSYSAIAGVYAEHYVDELSHKPLDRSLLDVLLTERPAGSTIADVGCGPGHVTRYLHDNGAAVVGIDVAPGMVDIARRRNPGIEFTEGSMMDLPVPDAAWGAVVALPASRCRLTSSASRTLRLRHRPPADTCSLRS
jgi:SAM-dependent methyltransferase